ncbi:MAG: hypothetical protein PUA68_06040 [Bacilli bacterium]|nr:hypothetical protein [Bacilli bacterium]
MKKGFTLIELIAIIIITSTIGILSYVTLTNTIKNNNNSKIQIFENNLISAAKLYITSNNEEINDERIITANELIEKKYLKKNVDFPEDIEKYYVRVYKNSENYIIYEVVHNQKK